MATTTVTTNCYKVISNEYNEKDIIDKPPMVVYEKTFEIDSASTTTTNSPIISSIQLDALPSICACNELLDSKLTCAECHQTSFKQLLSDLRTTETQLKTLKSERDSLLIRRSELDKESSALAMTIKEKEQNIQTAVINIESLKHDIMVLKTKYSDETNQLEDIQRSKENVKREIEELTQRLFEEANAMISLEKSEQKLILKKNEELESDLKSNKLQLSVAEDQLKVIRMKMDEQQQQQQQQQQHKSSFSNISENNNIAAMESKGSINLLTRAQLVTSLMHGIDIGLHIDVIEDDSALMEFNDFIQLSKKTQLRKLHSLKYMKCCLRDDIEPCLRFGPNPRMTSKKIIDAILVKSCFVEECSESFFSEQESRQVKEEATATLWERFTTSSIFFGCQACGRKIKDPKKRAETLKYKFRISYFDEWACIDRYCRDRLMAVIEYYDFVRHLRAGAYKHRSLHELYQESTRLKLQVFLARMGTLSMVLQSCGIGSEKIATAFQGENVNNSSTIITDSNLAAERISSSTESSITISTINSARTSTSFV
ncbi:hypothetical protein BDF20DRAFT_909543 [Mycotypha africana]|uniref:uncharacterized protein n=1 Tax=Mycotypha africana TaxID=64632 RepID=UPI002300B574|nr:uncharacterized protein BDF20DRAFT_909543 [Mycotypha africana]KAI8991818.1 hypothetical protein BDF20DRAFT_909543 [Mycotypha africana]